MSFNNFGHSVNLRHIVLSSPVARKSMAETSANRATGRAKLGARWLTSRVPRSRTPHQEQEPGDFMTTSDGITAARKSPGQGPEAPLNARARAPAVQSATHRFARRFATSHTTVAAKKWRDLLRACVEPSHVTIGSRVQNLCSNDLALHGRMDWPAK